MLGGEEEQQKIYGKEEGNNLERNVARSSRRHPAGRKERECPLGEEQEQQPEECTTAAKSKAQENSRNAAHIKKKTEGRHGQRNAKGQQCGSNQQQQAAGKQKESPCLLVREVQDSTLVTYCEIIVDEAAKPAVFPEIPAEVCTLRRD